jgi:programmed cell death protein 5
MEDKQQQKQQEKQDAMERRGKTLAQILTPDARERLSRVSLVKPEKAIVVEDHLIQLAQARQLGGKVDESRVIELLESISAKKETKIVLQQKRGLFDDDF